MSSESPKEERLYLVFVIQNAPMQLVSSNDLVKEYLDQLEDRKRRNDWTTPFLIRDDDGHVIAAYSWGTMIGVVQGRKLQEGEQIP